MDEDKSGGWYNSVVPTALRGDNNLIHTFAMKTLTSCNNMQSGTCKAHRVTTELDGNGAHLRLMWVYVRHSTTTIICKTLEVYTHRRMCLQVESPK